MQSDPKGFASLVDGLLDDIFKFATLMPRVAKNDVRSDYLSEVDEIIELAEIRDEILRRVDVAILQVWYLGLYIPHAKP